jgi:uncharacterized protein (DUF2164 family)
MGFMCVHFASEYVGAAYVAALEDESGDARRFHAMDRRFCKGVFRFVKTFGVDHPADARLARAVEEYRDMNSEAFIKMLNAAMTAAFADDLGRPMNRRERLHDAALIIEERLRAFDDAEMSGLREVVELLREHHSRAAKRCAARKHPALDRKMRPWLDTYDGWAARVASAADESASAAASAAKRLPAAKRPPSRRASLEEVPTPARKSASRAAARRRSGDDDSQPEAR